MFNSYLGLIGLVLGWLLGVFGPYILVGLKTVKTPSVQVSTFVD